MTPEKFYSSVASIFNAPHEYVEPTSGATKKRWGPREPGNGRYEGRGIVRVFSPSHIHVALYRPALNGRFGSMDEALEAIKEAEARRILHWWFHADLTGVKTE